MTDTPDFDKMTPEEIMKWMESLAVRQGATEGLTTSADMDIGSVSEDDERLKNTGEYIPYGMKKEDWEKQKAKEDEQKRQRMSSQPPKPAQAPTPAAPPPPPVQQPAASAPVPPPAQPAPAASQPSAASDTPDFDNMSPDEIMKWMESLAKRQGAEVGFTTSADMEVAEVSADDERLKDKGEYIPYAMKAEDWEKMKAKEEEEKRQRLARQQPPAAAKPPAASIQPPAAAFQPPAPPEPVIQPPSALDDFLTSDLPNLDMEEEETVVAGGQSNPVDWLSNVAHEPDEFDFGSLDSNLISDEDDPFKALADLSANDNNMDWLSSLGDDSGLDALAGLADLGSDSDPLEGLDFLNEPAAPTRPAAATVGPQPGENSLEWLESMARDHGASDEELMTPANLNVTRPNETRTDGPGYTPYSFETTNDTPDAVPVSADLDFLNEDDGSPEDWLDDVARGVATGEVPPVKPTARTPEPAPQEDDVADDVMARLAQGHDVAPDDITKMFESFFERAEQFADKDEDFDAPPAMAGAEIPDDIPDEALKAEIPDWLRDQMIVSSEEPAPSADASKMDALMSMFDEEAALPGDFTAQSVEDDADAMPDWMLSGSEVDGLDTEIKADSGAMPDWLRQTPDDDIPALTSSEVPALDGDLPDWLQASEGEGSDENIFADITSENQQEDNLGELIIDSDDLESVETLEGDPGFAMDSDPWVVALTLEEEASDQLSQWYAEKTGSISGDNLNEMLEDAIAQSQQPTPAMASAQSAMPVLKAAELPLEAVLVMGEAQPAPDWLLGSAAMPAASVAPSASYISAPATDEEDIPDWLRQDTEPEDTGSSSDMDDIPEWLRDQVDDSVVEGTSDLPPWLASEDVEETEGDEIPEWLRETMAEEEAPSTSFTPDAIASAPTVVMPAPNIPSVPATPTPAPVHAQPAAIQPVKSSPAPMVPVNIDVASTLQAARGKVSSGDIEGSLADYEMIVRANTSLDEVVRDLSKLVEHKDHKRNPTVYRVLGDTLMRRGELKTALETYRKALHML